MSPTPTHPIKLVKIMLSRRPNGIIFPPQKAPIAMPRNALEPMRDWWISFSDFDSQSYLVFKILAS